MKTPYIYFGTKGYYYESDSSGDQEVGGDSATSLTLTGAGLLPVDHANGASDDSTSLDAYRIVIKAAASTTSDRANNNTIIGGNAGDRTGFSGDNNICIGQSSDIDTGSRDRACALGQGVGTNASDSSFRVVGEGGVYNTGNTSTWNTTSDIRIKKDIARLETRLTELRFLKGENNDAD